MMRALCWAFGLCAVVAGCDARSTVGYNERRQALDAGGAVDAAASGAVSCAESSPLAACSKGTCTVKVVYDTYRGNVSIAVDDDNVFYRSGPQAISRRSLRGGDPVELTTFELMMRLTADETHVFWTEQNGTVRAVPKAGGGAFDVANVFGNPLELAVDATHVYWVIPELGKVAMAPKGGGEPSHIVGQTFAQAITVDGAHVYWGNAGEGEKAGQIARAPRGNLSGAEVLLSNVEAPISIVVTDSWLVWASARGVFRVPKENFGAAVEELTSGLAETKRVVVYGDTIYGVGMDGFWSVPLAGGTRTTLEQLPMSAIALTCAGVYASGWFEPVLLRYAP